MKEDETKINMKSEMWALVNWTRVKHWTRHINLPEMKMFVFLDVEMSLTLWPLKMRCRLLKMSLNHILLKTGRWPRLLKMRRRLCKQWVWSQETLAMLSGGYKRLEKSICLHRLSRKSNKYQMSAHVEFYRRKLGFNQSLQNQSPQTMDHVFQCLCDKLQRRHWCW